MKTLTTAIVIVGLSGLLFGCVNNAERLGSHVAKLSVEQTYNPNATQDNLGFIPTGSGERMETSYKVYTGKQDSELTGNESQVLQGFGE